MNTIPDRLTDARRTEVDYDRDAQLEGPSMSRADQEISDAVVRPLPSHSPSDSPSSAPSDSPSNEADSLSQPNNGAEVRIRGSRVRAAMRTGLFVIGVLSLVAAAVFAWWHFFRDTPLVGFASGNGRVEATEIDIATKVPGRIESVLVEEGDLVEAGQILARIDVESLEAQLEEAQASLQETIEAHRAAGATFNRQDSLRHLAEKEFERARKLFDADVSSAETLDRRRTERETSVAAVEQATRQLKQAERAIEVAAARVHRLRIDVKEGSLFAPRPGRVLYRLAEPGEVLPTGGKVLSLIEEGDAYLTLFLPEREAAQVRVGSEARVRLDGFPDRLWPATVSYVAPKAQFTPKQVETAREREKLVFKLKVRFPDSVDPLIKPGMRGVAIVRLDPEIPWPEELR